MLPLASREALPAQAVPALLPQGPGTSGSPHLDGGFFPAFGVPADLGNAALGHVGAAQGAFSSGGLENAHFSHGTPTTCSVGCRSPVGTSLPLSSRRARSISEGNVSC